MKRDMDLVREILLEVESWSNAFKWRKVVISERDPAEVGWHVGIMTDAGLLIGNRSGMEDGRVCRLTWEAHEFLDNARDPQRWEAAKKTVSEKAGAVSFDVFKALLIQLARKAVFGGEE